MRLMLFRTMLVLFILETTPLHQIVKSPLLVEHFIEHRALNQSVGFLEFLAMHYGGNDMNDDDDERDNALPFKRFEVQSASFLFIPAVKISVAVNNAWPIATDYGLDKPQLYFNPALDTLFRPPKV